MKRFFMSMTLGLAEASLRIANPPPAPRICLKCVFANAANLSQSDPVAEPPLRSRTVWLRSGSYISRMLACANASADPCLFLTVHAYGCDGLPSILIGRPSKLVTSSGCATPPNSHTVAYCSGTPGMRPAGLVEYGARCSLGQRRQPVSVKPAIAIDAPINFKNRRRDGPLALTIDDGS